MRALFGFLYAPRAAMMAGPLWSVDDTDFRRWEAEAARRRQAVRGKMQEIWDVVAEPWPAESGGDAGTVGSNPAAPEGQVPEA